MCSNLMLKSLPLTFHFTPLTSVLSITIILVHSFIHSTNVDCMCYMPAILLTLSILQRTKDAKILALVQVTFFWAGQEIRPISKMVVEI